MNKLRQEIVIRKCDNLNKENFWNIAMEIYPNATKEFCKFVDYYKKVNHVVSGRTYTMNFNDLFSNDLVENGKEIKFHHLPIEMQIGIIFRFFEEQGVETLHLNIIDYNEVLDGICNTLEFIEARYK